MVNHTADISQHKAAKVAGLAYFLIIITSILSMIFGPYKLIVEGDVDNVKCCSQFCHHKLIVSSC